MKIILALICIISFTTAFPSDFQMRKSVESALSNINFNVLPKELVEKLAVKFESDVSHDLGDISTIINEYADQIFANLQIYINDHDLNVVELPDATLKLEPSGHVDLTNGHLQDINTIGRREDVVLSYSSNDKKLILVLPIKFSDLKFSYDYHTKYLFVSIHGGVHGSITDTSVNADLSFDFTTYQAALDHYDMKDSGKISIKFTGNSVVDWLSNAMSSVLTTFLGQVVVNVIAKVVRDSLRGLVDDINEAIAKIINP